MELSNYTEAKAKLQKLYLDLMNSNYLGRMEISNDIYEVLSRDYYEEVINCYERYKPLSRMMAKLDYRLANNIKVKDRTRKR